MNQKQLYNDLSTQFDDEALQTLCERLRVNYDYLAGFDLPSRAQALINTMERWNRMSDLVAAMVEIRPYLNPDAYADPETADGDDNLSWIDDLAAGGGTPIEEPPTWKWPGDPPGDDDNG